MKNYFASNLKYLREKNKLEQQDLAEIWHIPRSTLSCWENGLRTPKIEQIQKIAEYFNVNIDIVSRDYSKDIESGIEDHPNPKKYIKQILKSKNFLDENGNISIEKFDELNKYLNNNLNKK